MKYKIIKLLVLNIVILLGFQLSFAANLILPKKRKKYTKKSTKIIKKTKTNNEEIY